MNVLNMTKEDRDGKPNQVVSIATTILLGLIAIATAWSGFQATKWGGKMTNLYAAAGVARSNSVETLLTANQETLLDVQLFVEWINAINENDTRRSEFYFQRMRDEVTPVMEAWLATNPADNPDAPESPFAMPVYIQKKRLEAVEKELEAVDLTEQAIEANKIGDDYVLTTVILATGLFFAGIAPLRTRHPQIQVIIFIMALAAFLYGTYLMISYPVLVS